MLSSCRSAHLYQSSSLDHKFEETVQIQRLLGHDGNSSDGITCSISVKNNY